MSLTLDLRQRFSNPVRYGTYFLSGRGLIYSGGNGDKSGAQDLCQSRQLNLPQNNRLGLCFPMLKIIIIRTTAKWTKKEGQKWCLMTLLHIGITM